MPNYTPAAGVKPGKVFRAVLYGDDLAYTTCICNTPMTLNENPAQKTYSGQCQNCKIFWELCDGKLTEKPQTPNPKPQTLNPLNV